MITILSHRGYWKTDEEKNAPVAFQRSFEAGFGTETDIRDRNGELVISHDPPTSDALSLGAFLELYKRFGDGLPLALNIKADGLQGLLQNALARHDVSNYFVFDMSVPDALPYLRAGMNVFTRQSEYESSPSFYETATGVWIDGFHGDWLTEMGFSPHVWAGKRVCLVSPDLHKRPYEAFWRQVKTWCEVPREADVMLCTDFPEEASRFFNDANEPE